MMSEDQFKQKFSKSLSQYFQSNWGSLIMFAGHCQYKILNSGVLVTMETMIGP